MKVLENTFTEHDQVLNDSKTLIPQINRVAEVLIALITKQHTIFFMGNGGSAADAQHLAAELIGRFRLERKAIPAIALSTDTSVLTCLTNDYDYSIVFSRQLEALCKPGDAVIGISTSGNSMNVIKGIEVANQKGAYTVALTGKSGGKLSSIAKECIKIPSINTARIQEIHIMIGHALCEMIEQSIFQEKKARSENLTSVI